MKATEAIQASLQSTQPLLAWYLGDLADGDLLVRPVPGANHIAWQLGHLILSERSLITRDLPQAKYPELSAAFVAQHEKAKASEEPPTGFSTKEEYPELFNRVRGVTIATAGALSDAELDTPTKGDMAKFAPTLAHLFLLVSNHTLMHAG